MAAKRPPRRGVTSPTPPALKARGGEAAGASIPLRMCPIAPAQCARDHAALAVALDPIVTIDAGGVIQSVSDSIQRVFGWTPSELIGRNVNVLMPEPERAAHDVSLERYQITGITRVMNNPRRFEAVHKDGTAVPIEVCVSRAELFGSWAPLYVGIIRDLSMQADADRGREQEREASRRLLADQTSALQQANLRLRMADRMASIGTLAAGLGHDMNSVLLPVRARLNALTASGERGRISKADRKHVQDIGNSVAYLQQLADGLHFLAMDPETREDVRGGGSTTDVPKWWAQVGSLLSKAVPKHVRVSAAITQGLPPVLVAPHALTQAMLNLIVNAGEAIRRPDGGEQVGGSVRVWAERDQDEAERWVRIGVSDDGSGMSEEVKRRAFEMFFTTKPRGLGTGLGLALVRKVAERAGGRVELESERGRGTTVTLVLPAAPQGQHAEGRGMGQSARVSISSGRAAAIVRHILESSGTVVCPARESRRATIWVVDPADVSLREVKAWRTKHPDGGLVLFGCPRVSEAPAWNELRPVNVKDTEDFDLVRSALAKAIAGRNGKGSK